MTPPSEEHIATHREPLRRELSNFVFLAALDAENGNREWEQLWGRVISPQRVEVCCIPFFVYDLNLGDVVDLDPNNILAGVITRSGQLTFRAWLESVSPEDRQKLLAEVDATGTFREWSSPNLIALSVHETRAHKLADLLEKWAARGPLVYENGAQLSEGVSHH
jgi:hypothetical protein